MSQVETQDITSIGDYFEVLRRRKGQLLLAFGILLLITVLLAFGLPSAYRSTAVILIEEQDIPTDLVQSTITSFADQQIQVISQRSMTSPNIINIIEQFNLYPEDRERIPQSELVERVRENTTLELISADVIDPRSGRPTQATIAFTLSFDHPDPSLAQRVADSLVTVYLEQSIDSRKRQAAQTSTFFTDEVALIQTRVQRLEGELAQFKRENSEVLPELYPLNLQALQRNDADMVEVQRQMQQLNERRLMLDSQLAGITPSAPVNISGQTILAPEARLAALESEYVSKSGLYGPNHPDVVRLKREIDALRLDTGQSPDISEIDRKLVAYREQLRELRERYADEHPDVVRAVRQVEGLEQEQQRAESSRAVAAVPGARIAVTDDVNLRVNVRATASTDGKVVGFLARNQAATLLDENIPGWYHIQLQGGADGYVSTSFTRPVKSTARPTQPTNPIYIQIASQRDAAEAELRGLLTTFEALKQKRAQLEDKILAAPEVERQYSSLTRDLDNERAAYQEARQKQVMTQRAEKVEGSHGQRFTVIEPAITPIAPHWPPRLEILLAGIALSIAGALGVGVVSESMDSALRSPAAVAALFGGTAPLAVIPYIDNVFDSRRSKRNIMVIVGTVLLVVAVALVAVHFLIKPLDVLWYAMMRRMGA